MYVEIVCVCHGVNGVNGVCVCVCGKCVCVCVCVYGVCRRMCVACVCECMRIVCVCVGCACVFGV